MNTKDLLKLLTDRCKGVFVGIFACDRLPVRLPHKRPLLIVCNTDPHYKPGEHWIAMYFGSNGIGEYFHSYGLHPALVFEKYLNYNFCSFIRNEKTLQSVLSRFCGHYCVFFCLFKMLNYDVNSITNCFTDDTALNDASLELALSRPLYVIRLSVE